MKIVLINSPILLEGTDGDERSYYPLNLLYLASSLEKAGHKVRVVDMSAEGLTIPQIQAEMAILAPKLIGISAMTPGIQSAIVLAKALRKYAPIALGGVHLTCDTTFIERHPYFDFGVAGEAEKTLPELVSRMEKGEKLSGVYKGEPIEDLDTIPFPARHLIDPSIYKRKEQLKFEVPAAGILGSRGCPYNCIFCSIPARGKKVRFRSAKNVVDEMEVVYDSCKGSYSFVDDCFTINRQRIIDFCTEILRRKIKVQWIASTRADTLTDELGKLLKEAGCKELYFGIESGNERIRNQVIGKQLDIQHIKQAVDICHKHRIISNLFIMVGFPSESRENLKETINIGSKVKADNIGIHITMPFPGSRLYEETYKNYEMIDKFALSKGFRGVYPMYVPEGLTLKDLVDAKKKAYRSFYLNPWWMLRRLRIWFVIRGKFRDDLKLFKLIWQVFGAGQTRGQLS